MNLCIFRIALSHFFSFFFGGGDKFQEQTLATGVNENGEEPRRNQLNQQVRGMLRDPNIG